MIAGAGCGILVGEGHVSNELIWDLAIFCAYMQVWPRSHCRIVLPLVHFAPDSLRWSVSLFLKRQCGRIPMQVPLATWAFCGRACAPWKAVFYPFLWSD